MLVLLVLQTDRVGKAKDRDRDRNVDRDSDKPSARAAKCSRN